MLISPRFAGNVTQTGNYVHCLWSCVKLQRYWSGIVDELSAIFGVSIQMDPMCLILGLSDGQITDSNHRRLFNRLTEEKEHSALLGQECSPNKKIMAQHYYGYITCMLHSKRDVFYKVWDPYLQHIGPTLSSSLLRGFPRSA